MKKLFVVFILFISCIISTNTNAYANSIPENILLQVGSDESERMFAWYSHEKNENSFALISKNSNMENAEKINAKITESLSATFGYEATAKNLTANTTYFYQVSLGSTMSEIYTFKTGEVENELSFIVAGDVQIGTYNTEGLSKIWQANLKGIAEMYPNTDFIMSVGDQVDVPNSEAQYDAFTAAGELRQFPLAVTIGNHDGSSIFSSHFAIPNVSNYGSTASRIGVDGGDSYFVQGDVLFMNLNTNGVLSEANHREFMEITMAKIPHDWAVVYMHHAPFSAGSHAKDGLMYEMRASLVQTFSELGIDLVICGHDHVYTRSHLMNGAVPVAPTSTPTSGDVLIPNEGEVLYVTVNSSSGSKYYPYHADVASFDFIAVANQEYVPNISNIVVTDNGIKFSTYRFANGQHSLVDEVTLQREIVEIPEVTVEPEVEIEATVGLGIFRALTFFSGIGNFVLS